MRLGAYLHMPFLLESRPLLFLHRVQQISWLGSVPRDNIPAAAQASRQGCYQSSRMFKYKVLEAAANRCTWPAKLCSKLVGGISIGVGWGSAATSGLFKGPK